MLTLERRAQTSSHRLVVALIVLATLTASFAVLTSSSAAPSGARAAPLDSGAVAAQARPAAFNPPCAYVTATVCVSLADPSEPNIIPTTGEFSSAVEPSNTTSLPLFVKSEKPLNGTSPILNGPDSPVTLNVTANLWNGDQYYTPYDGTIWHTASAQNYIGPLTPAQTGNNQTYPWWYEVNFSARSTTGHPNFLAGMSITWWIEITVNDSGTFLHNESPRYTFTYAGAWPASPYPNSRQYAGTAAFDQDLTVRVVPTQPNWNDSLAFTLHTTAADAPINATIHLVRLSLSEVASNGTPLGSTVIQYQSNNSLGVTTARLAVPASWSQDPNATVTYSLAALDAWGDQVVSSPTSYRVGGNGSFGTSYFADELTLTASPNVTTSQNLSELQVGPGTPVNLTLASRNAGVAVNAAEVVYGVSLPEISTLAQRSFYLARVNSTTFVGTIPGLPLGAEVSFVVLAWDFSSHLLESAPATYLVESFSTLVPTFNSNATYVNSSFFYVGVYDAGASSWVNGAHVEILGPSGFIHSVGTTWNGLAYPNATGQSYVPLVLPAGATYLVNVSYGGFDQAISFLATHALAGHQVLRSAGDWSVVQEGALLLFTLNASASAPGPAASPAATGVLEVATIAGLAAAAVALFPLVAWWRRIQARREADLKRVTL